MKNLIALAVLFISFSGMCVESSDCPSSDKPVTTPAPVDLSELKKKIRLLQDEAGKPFFTNSTTLDKSIEMTFDTSKVKTKMAQFYTMLWIISEELTRQQQKQVTFSRSSVHDVLLESKVFTDPAVPNKIKTIQFDFTNKERPRCIVTFENKNIEVPLNQGEGFYIFRSGKCQHALKLNFAEKFSFEMKKNLGNLMVTNFKGVDLIGDFGSRGIIDVDIQFISLKSVEFFDGTVDGRVTAYVSREEFKQNKHNALLEFLTRIVPDRSVQPIDW